MLTFKELKFRAIGRFVEEQHIIFDTLGNLIQVDGKNNNTGGSSGAAKSTIFDAIDFLFGISAKPNIVLQSRETEEHIWVEGIFDYDGLPLTITRGKKLKIDLNGEVTTGSAKLSEEKLDKIMAIPRKLFKPMLHKTQGEKGFFLSLTPKETNDFLIDCLNLSTFRIPLANLDIKLKDLAKKKEALLSNMESAKTGVEATARATETLGKAPVQEVDQATILSLKGKSETSQEAYKRLSEAHTKELTDLASKRPTILLVPFDATKKSAYKHQYDMLSTQKVTLLAEHNQKNAKLQAQIHELQLKVVDLRAKVEKGRAAKQEAATYAAQILKIRNSQCPKCEQQWATDAAKKEEAQLLENISQMKSLVIGGDNASIQLEAVSEQIQYLRSGITDVPDGIFELDKQEREVEILIDEERKAQTAHMEAQNLHNKTAMESFDLLQKTARDRHAMEMEQIRGQATLDQRVFEAAVSRFKAFDEAKTRYDKSYVALVEQERKYTVEKDRVTKELTELDSEVECYEELKRAAKSYLSCSFDEALETISEGATRLVRQIPNMANATVQLVGVWETSEGKVKEEVNAVLNLDGHENIDIRSFCGGERSAIDLAIDLSVIELIESKTNKGINLFILDEPFTGMDSICIEMALEVLKNSSNNKKLIIVDHNPEVKEMVESSLLVERTGSTSKVIQN